MFFTINKPLKGHDEDAPAYADDKLLIVCDGLGGSGQNIHTIDGLSKTSAYFGSRILSQTCIGFFRNKYDEICENFQNPGNIINELKKYIINELSLYVINNQLKNLIKGKSIQMLPSTMVAIIYKKHDDYTEALVVSAGDSRAFVLTDDKGLQQLSKDDVFGETDEYSKTTTMSNNICHGNDFHINYRYYKLPKKCLLFVCSDGCFDYVDTPMEFEYRMDYSICKSEEKIAVSPEGTAMNYGQILGEIYGGILEQSGLKDDCTVAGAVLGYESPQEMKKLFSARAKVVTTDYRKTYREYREQDVIRKKEFGVKIRENEKEIGLINAEIEKEVVLLVQKLFKLALTAEVDTQTTESMVSKHFNEESYRNFLLAFSQKELDDRNNLERVKERMNQIISQMKSIYDEASFPYFQKETINPGMGTRFIEAGTAIFNPKNDANKFIKIYRERYNKVKGEYDQAFNKYKEHLNENLKYLSELQITQESILFNNIQMFKYEEMSKLLVKYLTEAGNKHNEINSLNARFKEEYITSGASTKRFEKDFESNFVKFRGKTEEFEQLFREYCVLKEEKVKYLPLTEEQKQMKLNKYIEENKTSLINYVINNEEIANLVIGEPLSKKYDLQIQGKEFKFKYEEYDLKLKELWSKYKENYQLYNTSEGGRV